MSQKIDLKERKLIIDRYLSGESMVELSKDYSVTHQAIGYILRVENCNIRNHSDSCKIYSHDESYFDSIDTEDKAYFLGLLYADGYIRKSGKTFDLSLIDQDILIKFLSYLKSNSPMHTNVKINKDGERNKYFKISITSRRIVSALERNGCINKKTNRITFPKNMDDKLVRHFVRGYSDGDGCVSWNKNTKNVYWGLVGNWKFMNGIRKVLFEKIGLSLCVYHVRNDTYCICIGGNIKTMKILNWMYNDSNVYIKRKYLKFKECKRKIVEKILNGGRKYGKIKSVGFYPHKDEVRIQLNAA
jgi:hypothetical protein